MCLCTVPNKYVSKAFKAAQSAMMVKLAEQEKIINSMPEENIIKAVFLSKERHAHS
jgi:hypothetical protein